MDDHEMLQDKPHRTVVRVGDTVRRPLQPWSSSVHELLRYLEGIGYPHSPRFLGINADGREVVSFIDGESGGAGWAKVVDERGLKAMARLLREYHDAVREFRPAAVDGWAGRTAPQGDDELISHGDFGPWNLVWHGPQPVAVLDWDYAWPAKPIHDIAYALEYVAPFRDDETCVRWLCFPEPPNRRRRLELFAEAYGLESTTGLVDEVIAQQEAVWKRARRLADQGCQPQADWQATGFLDKTAARINWTRTNRQLFEPTGS
jgi:aminoglycoside phosphotransferase (APT) family kinase protein